MKVRELLEIYTEQLEQEELRGKTRQTYVNSLDRFLTRIYSREAEIKDIKNQDIVNGLKKLKLKTEASAVVNGLRRLKPYMDIPEEKVLKETIASKHTGPRKHNEVKELNKMLKKINVIRDKKLKLGYRLALVSGLRVFELANLKKGDIEISPSGIKINVCDGNGKGGKSAVINCLRDNYLEKSLKEHLESSTEEKVFYSKDYIMHKALESGIQCHDLRRAFCKLVYKEKKNEVGAYRANIAVQKAMRHTKFSTTKIYLNSKIKV
ncbi:tyrosine-type recombinase/integrase [Clostridium akagii]|uniref:tyrosine-type recombinase/integrase n=1 Tax=Clostridium akagii TaxID=91623 RepID=UPI00068E68AC|nr:tyrosine-type recombinase/integrase [Clostridium akagii]